MIFRVGTLKNLEISVKILKKSVKKIFEAPLAPFNPDREGAQKFLNLKFELKTLKF